MLPRPDDPIGRGIEALVALRPRAAEHLARGRYGALFAGWRAQLALLVRELAKDVRASRLATASDDALRALAASEFDTTLSNEPRAAIGEVRLERSALGGAHPAGVVRKGSRWRRAPVPTHPAGPLSEATYESTEDVVVPQGASGALVKIRATRAGAFGNTVLGESAQATNLIAPVDKLFDPALAPVWCATGGGADGTTDELLRRAARAYALGRYGPTRGALGAAALRAGAAHVALFDVPARALAAVAIADVSWGASRAWASVLEQQIHDDVEGFGCRAIVGFVGNRFVRVAADVTLRRAADRADTTDITAALGRALRVYFDLRPDWWTWKLSALRGVAARAHPRIQTCRALVVRDALTNAVLDEPTFAPRVGTGQALHLYLADNAVEPTYTLAR